MQKAEAINEKVEFIRLGYKVSLGFKVGFGDLAELQQAVESVKSYNEFNGKEVSEMLTQIWKYVSRIEFGRENSPVMYIHLPHWTHQRATSKEINGTRISDAEHRETITKIMYYLKATRPDELNVERYDDHVIRAWWD